jgi:hypothetical protein
MCARGQDAFTITGGTDLLPAQDVGRRHHPDAKEAGVLYVREERVPELWASDVGVGWEGALEGGARKFDNLGQRDDAAVSAMGAATRFH